jgi:hypothetical protein
MPNHRTIRTILAEKLGSLTISTLLLAVYLPVFIGISSATAESPGELRKCSHEQYLNKVVAQGSNGSWFQCSGSSAYITKSGKGKRSYFWLKIENPTITSDAKPGEFCFTPFKTVRTKYGKLKCQPVRVYPPAYMWIKQ